MFHAELYKNSSLHAELTIELASQCQVCASSGLLLLLPLSALRSGRAMRARSRTRTRTASDEQSSQRPGEPVSDLNSARARKPRSGETSARASGATSIA